MRKFIQKLAVLATAFVVAVTAVPAQVPAAQKATNLIKSQWTGYFGQQNNWQDGSDGTFTTGVSSFTSSISAIGYGGIWGAQSSTNMINVTPKASYTFSCDVKSTSIDKWILIKIADASDYALDGRWIQLKAGSTHKVAFTFTVPKNIKQLKVVFGMGGVQMASSGTWDVDELVRDLGYAAEEHDDGDSVYATDIVASNLSLKLATTTIKNVKGAKKKATVTLNTLSDYKQKDVKQYVVQYAKKANFKGAKKVKVSANKKKVTIKKLVSKKKYYFRVAVVNKNGKVGPWSAKKSVKVK